jgi:glycosyltransferase involved in cell wall biosynthesis
LATGSEVIVLSPPPKAEARRSPRWLPAVETRFSIHRQRFCCNWDAPKIRIPLSWVFYAVLAVRQTRAGDLVILDNYQFIHVVAAWCLKLFRRVHFMLDYEDGYHLIDKSWTRVLSWLAEFLERPLLHAALTAHPVLGDRLPPSLPRETVPGFIVTPDPKSVHSSPGLTQFLYSGSLDPPRGLDIVLAALRLLPEAGWHLHVTGRGPMEAEVLRFAKSQSWTGKVTFHGYISSQAAQKLLLGCDVGLNCQKAADPISRVTFPSKVFTYLSASLVVISSRASEVATICGPACIYYNEDTPEALATVMIRAVKDLPTLRSSLDSSAVETTYSLQGTAVRLTKLLGSWS